MKKLFCVIMLLALLVPGTVLGQTTNFRRVYRIIQADTPTQLEAQINESGGNVIPETFGKLLPKNTKVKNSKKTITVLVECYETF